MSEARLEHVNLTVANPLETAKMLSDVFGWHIRWQGEAINGGLTVHVGAEATYLALYTRDIALKENEERYERLLGLNHLGVVVDDLDDAEKRVRAAGFTPHQFDDYEPGKRFYFENQEGLELEVVSYQ